MNGELAYAAESFYILEESQRCYFCAKLSFNGYQGKYTVSVSEGSEVYTDTFYLEPGTGAKTVEINLEKYVPPVRILSTVKTVRGNSRIIAFNGRPVILAGPVDGK